MSAGIQKVRAVALAVQKIKRARVVLMDVGVEGVFHPTEAMLLMMHPLMIHPTVLLQGTP